MGDLDSLFINLRACLVSSKGGIPLKDLDREYFKLTGERIAFRSNGYLYLEDLLRSSDRFSIENRGGINIVHANSTQKTEHLTDLIKKQKSKPFKKIFGFSKKPVSRNNYEVRLSAGPLKTRGLVPRHTTPPPHSGPVNTVFGQNKNGIGNEVMVNETNNAFNSPIQLQHQQQQHIPIFRCLPTSMGLKKSAAQSRLQKYPKKFDQTSNKVEVENFAHKMGKDPCLEVNDDNDYIGELELYLKNYNLSEPYYDCMVKKEKYSKSKHNLHICTVKVIGTNISSYPVECTTVESARKVAAKHALYVLKDQFGDNVIYPITSDINMLAFHIKELLKSGNKLTGLMSNVLEHMYREKFKETLPDNWIQLLEVYSYFKIDKLQANKIIIQLNEMDNHSHQNSHGDINVNIEIPVEEQNIIEGTPLLFEDYDEKTILVSANYGTSCVWIRFVGPSADENFIQMQTKFNNNMNTTGFSIAKQVIEGEYYAVVYDSTWHRVRISSPIGEDGTVTCFMIDTGEIYYVSKDQIYNLEPVFMKTKLQAIACVLTGLDNFGTFYGLTELLNEMILNKTFIAIPDSLEDGEVRVTLYEKGETSSRVNVNDMIIQRFIEKTVTRLPSFEEHTFINGIITTFDDSGHFFLQLNFDVISLLEQILPNDECLVPELFLKNMEDIKEDQVYLKKYENDLWYRVKVIEIINNSKVKAIYIDYGNIIICEINKLVNLKMFDPLMAMIPPQALKVSMNLLPPSIMTPDIALRIMAIIENNTILVNVMNALINDIPCIQLYKIKYTEDESDLALCVNLQIALSLKKQ